MSVCVCALTVWSANYCQFCLLIFQYLYLTVTASSSSVRRQGEMLPSSTGVAVGQCYFIKMSYSYSILSHIEFLVDFCTVSYFTIWLLLISWASTASSEKTAQGKWKSPGLKRWRDSQIYGASNAITHQRT